MTRSGTQCPAVNGGSTHSTIATRGRATTRDLGGHSRQPHAERFDEVKRPFPYARAVPTVMTVPSTSSSEYGSSGQHVGATAQVVEGVADLVGRQRADPAQVLGEDQVGGHGRPARRRAACRGRARRHLRLHVVVDLGRAHPAGVPAADDHGLGGAGRRRLVTLEGHPDQVVAEPEGVDDLGRRGQQGHQSHTRSSTSCRATSGTRRVRRSVAEATSGGRRSAESRSRAAAFWTTD